MGFVPPFCGCAVKLASEPAQIGKPVVVAKPTPGVTDGVTVRFRVTILSQPLTELSVS